MVLQLLGILLVLLGVIYVGFIVYALLFTNSQLFPAPPSSYVDNEKLLKIESPYGHPITAVHIEKPQAEYTLLYCHGNAEDLGSAKTNYTALSIRCGYNVLAFDYPSYGTSKGRATPRTVVQAAEMALNYLTETKGIPHNRIILYGRSLGGGPATDLASRFPVGGLILEQTFASVYRTVLPFRILPWDHFDNLSKIPKVQCPLFILHGGADYVVPPAHGRQLLNAASGPAVHLWVDYAGHGDHLLTTAGKRYWEMMSKFQKVVESGKTLT